MTGVYEGARWPVPPAIMFGGLVMAHVASRAWTGGPPAYQRFTEKLPGPGRLVSRFARAGLTRAGHIPAQEKIGQLRERGAHIHVCGPSTPHSGVHKTGLAFGGVTMAGYLTFMEVMARADIHVFAR